jgi:hypothetical protein
MKKTIPVALLILSTLACGPSEEEIKEREMKERRTKEAEEALEKVRLESNAMLEHCLELHQWFLKARKEKDSGNPLPTLDEKMVFPALSRGGNTCLVLYSEPPKTRFSDGRYPEKYRYLDNWRSTFGTMPEILGMDQILKSLTNEVHYGLIDAEGVEKGFSIARTKANAYKYLAIIDGEFIYGRVISEKKVVKGSYLPGTFEGACLVFQVKDGKYLCRFPVSARNDDTIETTSRRIDNYLRNSLHLKVKKKAKKTLEEAFGQ